MVTKNIAVIFAGGTGERMENTSRPKQFLELRGKPVLAYTLEQFQRHPEIGGIILVALKGWLDYCAEMTAIWHLDKVSAIVPGGATGQESIRLGLVTAREKYGEDAAVLIHDGVRPLIDEATITQCIRSVWRYGSAITVTPLTETVMLKETNSGPYQIVDRDKCQIARAPQCFYLRDILEAHRRALEDHEPPFIDSASLMEHYGYPLYLVKGLMENIKITTESDFRLFCALMDARDSSAFH